MAPTVAVNISARQLADTTLWEHVGGLLRRFDLQPGDLTLELTESTLMEPNVASERTLSGVQELGVRLALDDFGTGYSSLSQLTNLTLDVVKVDRSFVDGLDDDSPQYAIVAAFVGMAHALGVRVVAEGVETHAQLEILRGLGCELAQGFLLGRPVEAAEVSGLLAAH